MDVAVCEALAALPPAGTALLQAGGADSFFLSAPWFATVIGHALPPDGAPAFLLASRAAAPVALLPMLVGAGGRQVSGLTSPYTCLFRPLVAPGAALPDIAAAFRALGRVLRRWPVLRLDALPQDGWPLEAALRGLREAGLRSRRYAHFGNWHEAVAGQSWADYLARRPGSLRETIRRRLAKAERKNATRFSLLAGLDPVLLEAGIADFEAVYARSWKEPEPFPTVNAAMMRAAAPLGRLRLGLLHVGDQPVAAQVWLVENGVASVLKLAHDEAFKPLSPGTVLTAKMIRHLLDEEHVSELDFGRGDDDYKRSWVGQRRQRIGVLLADPLQPRGLAALARHDAGRLAQAARRRLGR